MSAESGAREDPVDTEENAASWLSEYIVEQLPDMIFVKEASELRFVRFNRAGEELLGIPRDEMYGKTDFDFFPREQAEFFTEKDRLVLESDEPVDIFEEPLQTARGQRWLHTRKVRILGKDGQPAFLLGISRDITPQLSHPLLLLAQDAGAPGVAELRHSLLPIRNSTHELRSLMTTLQAAMELFGEILEGSDIAPPQLRQGYTQIQGILPQLKDITTEIEVSLGDTQDLSEALESILGKDMQCRISDVLNAAQDLSRAGCAKIGGAPLPDLASDPYIITSKFIAVSLVANGLSRIAARMVDRDLNGGIKIGINNKRKSSFVVLRGKGLSSSDYQHVAAELRESFGAKLTVNVKVTAAGLQLAFIVADLPQNGESASFRGA